MKSVLLTAVLAVVLGACGVEESSSPAVFAVESESCYDSVIGYQSPSVVQLELVKDGALLTLHYGDVILVSIDADGHVGPSGTGSEWNLEGGKIDFTSKVGSLRWDGPAGGCVEDVRF